MRDFSYKFAVSLIFLFLICWQVLLAFQGFDLADTGFHMSAFRFIIEDPYSVQYSMSFWLSDIVGHLWMLIWPEGGLFWGRMGSMTVLTIAISVYYKLLKPELGPVKAASSLLIVALFCIKGGFECLNYDVLTILGYAIAIALLFRGLLNEKNGMIFLSGLVIGISIFFKITNLIGILLFLLIPFYVYLKKDGFVKFSKLLSLAVVGTLLGAGLVLLLIRILGHWDLFFDNFAFISAMTNDSEASHGFLLLISSYMSGYMNALLITIIFLGSIFLFVKFSKKITYQFSRKFSGLFILGLIVIIALLMLLFGTAFWSKVRYLLIGLMFWIGIQYASDKTVDYKLRMLSFIGILLLFIAPIGSDSGLGKSMHGIWIIGPILLAKLDVKHLLRPIRTAAPSALSVYIRQGMIVITIVASILFAWQNTYYDAGSRLKKTFPIDHPKLEMVYTTFEKSAAINELIHEAFPLLEQEYLLSFIEIPMMNYLSDKRPFLSTSWPKLYYSPLSFEKKLKEALNKREELPIILRQKQNAKLEDWPLEKADPAYLTYPSELTDWPEHGIILNQFIEEYAYEVIWENEMFQVLSKK